METNNTHRCIFANLPYADMPLILGLHMDAAGHPIDLFAEKKTSLWQPFVNDSIYVGKVQKVLKEQGAFVRLSPEISGYLPFHKWQDFFYAKKVSKKQELAPEDEIVVQIKKQPIKTKEMVLSSQLEFFGDHLILRTDGTEISISNKLPTERKKHIKELFLGCFSEEDAAKFLIRTNACDCENEELLREADLLLGKYAEFLSHYPTRQCYELLYQGKSRLEEFLRRLPKEDISIKTDDEDLFTELMRLCQLPLFSSFSDKIFRYEDDYPLYKLYGLESLLLHLTKPIVWLPSGANIIIEQTEALTVIDVNSSRQTSKKPTEMFAVNCEAAKEIANQIRLRNLSGIIIVDFINVKSPKEKSRLLAILREETKTDACKVSVLDYTKLGLVEMTREKKHPSLKEVLTL